MEPGEARKQQDEAAGQSVAAKAGGVDYLPRVLEPFPLLPTAPLESVPAGAPLLSPPF